jgi:hypothetical protein
LVVDLNHHHHKKYGFFEQGLVQNVEVDHEEVESKFEVVLL